MYIAKVDLNQVPNKREKMIFFLAVVIFSFAFIKSCWSPSRAAITTIKSQLADSAAEKRDLKAILDTGSQDASQSWKGNKEIVDLYTKWGTAVGVAPDAEVMSQFSNPVFLKDVQLTNITFSDPDSKSDLKADGVVKRKFKATLYGDFMSIGNCLERIYNIPLLVVIENILISSTGDSAGHINADIEGVVYGWK